MPIYSTVLVVLIVALPSVAANISFFVRDSPYPPSLSLSLAQPPTTMSDQTADDANKDIGGTEGPEAMYVKLIASDGHEFVLKREHALTSGTIKAMLSGPGQFAENETNEVRFKEIP